MRIVEIEKLPNGGHCNQTIDHLRKIPEGWAVIPEDMVCDNFPFGEVKAEEINGVMTVTGWEAGEIPAPEPEPEPEPSIDERVTVLETETEELNEALNMILEGTVE